MKKFLKRFMTIAFVFVMAIALTGCGKESNNGGETTGGNNSEEAGKGWPTDVSYVPNIKYDGKGTIVDTKENAWKDQYMIYIKGADLKSANAYVDKLYDNGYTVLNMFSDEGKYLKQPKKDNHFKMGYGNADGLLNVQVNLHDGRDDYNLVITWANMN